MDGFQQEICSFKQRKLAENLEARQIAAFQLACGVDLSDVLKAGPVAALGHIARLARLIERERQRGIRRHWSYDLNRHIALKQVLERLKRVSEAPATKPDAA